MVFKNDSSFILKNGLLLMTYYFCLFIMAYKVELLNLDKNSIQHLSSKMDPIVKSISKAIFEKFPEITIVENRVWKKDEVSKEITIRVAETDISEDKDDDEGVSLEEFQYTPLRYVGKSEFCNNVPILSYYHRETGLTNITKIDDCFRFCDKLKVIDCSLWDVSKVENMSGMFYCCSSLESLDISSWNTSKVKDMSYMFSGCESLKTLDISSWNTSKVKDMSYMFYECKSLESLDISSWNTSKVENMSVMFSDCLSLKNLDLSKWDISQVDNMCAMFCCCKSLKSLDLSQWDIYNVRNMIYMFKDCTKLKRLKFPVIDTEIVVCHEMFYNTKVRYRKIITVGDSDED